MKPYLAVPDRKLPAAELLLDPAAIQSFLGSDEFHSLKVTNIRYKPGTSCLVSYTAFTDNSEVYLHAKAFQRTDWSTRKRKFDNAQVLDDERCFAVWQFPVDSDLPACSRLFNDRERFLKRLLPESNFAEGDEAVEILAYKPNRRLVAKVDLSNGKSIVVKLHDKRTFKSALSAAKALKRVSSIDTPIRLARSKRHRLLAYEWIDGEPMDLDGHNIKPGEIFSGLFEWICRFQSSISFKKLKKLPMLHPGSTVRRQAKDLSKLCPNMQPFIAKVANLILDQRPSSPRPILSHGDFHRKQVLLDGNRVRILDLDNLCVATATSDIANFVAQLCFESVSEPRLVDVSHKVDAICQDDWYLNNSLAESDYNWDLAVAMFRLSTQFFRCGDPDWQSKTWKWLEGVEKRTEKSVRRKAVSFVKVDAPKPIRKATDPEEATAVFHSKLPAIRRKFGDYHVNHVAMIRNKPGRRCLLEFELHTSQGQRWLLGKYREKGIDSQTHAITKSLYRDFGFSRNSVDGISVPKTFGKYRLWNMWFQERIEARTIGAMMASGQLSTCVEPIVNAAFKLHRCGIESVRRHSVDSELAILRKQLQTVRQDNAELNLDLARILTSCESAAERIDKSVSTPIHRDYYQDQLLIGDQRCWLIDLDLVAIGHPGTDIGNFCAHLIEDGIRNYGDAGYWDEERSAIMDRYLRLNSQKCSREDLEIFQALSLARHIAISWRIPERRWSMRKVLAEARDHLDRILSIKSSTTRDTGVTT